MATITTANSKQIWQSPDGQRTIYEVWFTSDNPNHVGKTIKALTYSGAIAERGFLGKVETYTKNDKNGHSQTYLRQAPKEQDRPITGSTGADWTKNMHNRAMYDSYAKDIAVAFIEGPGLSENSFMEAIKLVSKGADLLFSGAALGIAIYKDVEDSLEGRGRVEKEFGRTELLHESDPFENPETT